MNQYFAISDPFVLLLYRSQSSEHQQLSTGEARKLEGPDFQIPYFLGIIPLDFRETSHVGLKEGGIERFKSSESNLTYHIGQQLIVVEERMTEEELILDQRVRHKRLFRSSRESYSDDDSDTNRTPVASVQQEEEVLYEIDPRALGKLPERLQNNYRQLFQERVERLAQKNPNFKYRQYDYMDYWPEEAFSPEEEEQPRYMKRKYPRKHKVLQGLEIAHVSRLKATEQKEQLPVLNPDLSP
ncbi:conserved hypothetical protein, partial [Histoplasma capsulatum H143]